jgi:hypothetical protein
MPRTFNTTGPCEPDRHYMLPAEGRLPDLLPRVQAEQYFVVHAPRQTGKTTAIRAFAARLRGLGYAAVWATLEESQGVDLVEEAEALWITAIARGARHLSAGERPPPRSAVATDPPGSRLGAWLGLWCAQTPAPVVLLLDEADTVSGPALVSLLRQLRAGFVERGPGRFPVSVGLVGMRDLRDYLTHAKDGAHTNPGSPFNIKAESITLRNFTRAEVAALLGQHTEETGQGFALEAIGQIAHQSAGQPYLVNALALGATQLAGEQTVSLPHVEAAREALIRARSTHLDALAERLRDPRVAPVIQAVLLGDLDVETDTDDYQLTVDLGLIDDATRPPTIANPLYREILARQLARRRQDNLPAPWWPWRSPSGGLDMAALIAAFLEWWRENGDQLVGQGIQGYPEAVPHLTFMAFLQRVVNGGGRVSREFAVGRGAIDLLVEYGDERFVIELKRIRPQHDSPERVVNAGLRQLGRYLDAVGVQHGWLLIFDQRPGQRWEDRLWASERIVDGKTVSLRGA